MGYTEAVGGKGTENPGRILKEEQGRGTGTLSMRATDAFHFEDARWAWRESRIQGSGRRRRAAFVQLGVPITISYNPAVG